MSAQDTCSIFCSSLGALESNPGDSQCHDIYQNNQDTRGVSGNYWAYTTTGVRQVYCDMTLDSQCGGQAGGWMRIADLNVGRGDACPSGWTKFTTPVAACIAPNENPGCYAVDFSTFNIPYSKVCGMAVGYQSRTIDAFLRGSLRSIDQEYVDGVSITYGNPRMHLWTYAIGFSERDGNQNTHCPCSAQPGRLPPPFVDVNYHCESGRLSAAGPSNEVMGVFPDDPVWDGMGCSDGNNCCSGDPAPPWFYRQLSMTITEDIETRICRDELSSSEDVLVRELQLYVQ